MYSFSAGITDKNVDELCALLLTLNNDDNENLFNNVARIAFNVLSIPHSKAQCERVFNK